MTKKQSTAFWLSALTRHVEAKPLVLLRLDEKDSESLRNSRLGFNEFTLARSHDLFSSVKTPAICLIFETASGQRKKKTEENNAFFGVISSCSTITTLETRIKVKRATTIYPGSEVGVLKLLIGTSYHTPLAKKLNEIEQVVTLPPKLGGAVVKSLSEIRENHASMSIVAESIYAPSRYENSAALQEDAVQSALKAFGLSSSDRAEEIELVQGKSTALSRLSTQQDASDEAGDESPMLSMKFERKPLIEDSAIEKDARSLPGYKLTSSDLTGRALFKKGNEQLEIFTANRRDLEHVFGVDLVYLNLSKKSMVMVQYKMLEPNNNDSKTDWIYRPDKNIHKEISRMEAFFSEIEADPIEYRLNSQVFYFKFVKRDGALSNGGIVTTVDHYKKLLNTPLCKGPREGIRISFDSLDGRYLRQGAFLDLIKSGYIGSYGATTDNLEILVKSVLDGNRAVIAAVQSSTLKQ